MKAFKALIPFLAVGLLVACNKQATKNGISSPNGNPAPVAEGTGDWGGGNGIDNKVIERYAVDITTLPEFKEIIEPIGEHIRNIPSDEPEEKSKKSENMYKIIASARTWIFAPVSLEVIEKKRIGADFSKDPIDQLALQSDKEVWVDLNRYNKMSKDEKAALLMHELVMIHYRLRFLTMQEMCLITRSCEGMDGFENIEKNFPEIAAKMKPEPSRKLEKSDYEFIRGATVYLLAKYTELKNESDMRWFSRTYNFDKRMYADMSSDGEFDDSVQYNITEKSIQGMLEQMPYETYFCNYSADGKAQEKCRLNLTLEKETQKRKVLIATPEGKTSEVEINFEINKVIVTKFSRLTGATQKQFITQNQWQQAGNGAWACPSGKGMCIKYTLIEYKSSDEMKALKTGSKIEIADLFLSLSTGSDNETSIKVDSVIQRTAILSSEEPLSGNTYRKLVLIPASAEYDHSKVISVSEISKQPFSERAIEPSWVMIAPN